MPESSRTGRGIRVVIIDSGVNAAHPHVGSVAGGTGIGDDGRPHPDYLDRLGHGTAVAAVVREKAPDAEIHAVKVGNRNRIPYEEYQRWWDQAMGDVIELVRDDLREDLFGTR